MFTYIAPEQHFKEVSVVVRYAGEAKKGSPDAEKETKKYLKARLDELFNKHLDEHEQHRIPKPSKIDCEISHKGICSKAEWEDRGVKYCVEERLLNGGVHTRVFSITRELIGQFDSQRYEVFAAFRLDRDTPGAEARASQKFTLKLQGERSKNVQLLLPCAIKQDNRLVNSENMGKDPGALGEMLNDFPFIPQELSNGEPITDPETIDSLREHFRKLAIFGKSS